MNKIYKTRCDSNILVCKELVFAILGSCNTEEQNLEEYLQGSGLEGLSKAQKTACITSQS